MQWIAVSLAFLGVVLLLVGFWKNRRGVLVVAGVLLFVAGSLGDFVDRWVDTARQAEAEARAINDAPVSAPTRQDAPVAAPAAEPETVPPPVAAPASAPGAAPALPPAP